MSKEDFVSNANAPESMAQKAWDVADGEEERARELLEVDEYYVKGEFLSSSDPVHGFFLVYVSATENTVSAIRTLVLNSDEVDDLSANLDREDFVNTLERKQTSEKKMNANTEQLSDLLSEPWQDSNSRVREAMNDADADRLKSVHQELLSKEFDFNIGETIISIDSKRRIEDQDTSSGPSGSSTESDEEVELPCQVDITPTQGVPVAKLSSGDEIYLEIGDVDTSDRNIKRRLEATADQETGMVTGSIVSKKSSDAGTINLRVRFSEDVFGTASCGKDVSIRAPDRTRQRYSGTGNQDTIEFLKENWIAVATGVIVFILLISLILVLTGI